MRWSWLVGALCCLSCSGEEEQESWQGAQGGTAGVSGSAGTAGAAGGSGAATAGEAGVAGQSGGAGASGEAGASGGAGTTGTVYCVPGATAVCACSDPIAVGVQGCLADGSGYGECDCGTAGAGGTAGEAGASGAAGTAGTAGSSGESGSAGEGGSAGAAGDTGGWLPCMAPEPYEQMTCNEYSDGTSTCFVSGGACLSCGSGWLDCDTDPSNGCETRDVYDELTCCWAQNSGHDYAPEIDNCYE